MERLVRNPQRSSGQTVLASAAYLIGSCALFYAAVDPADPLPTTRRESAERRVVEAPTVQSAVYAIAPALDTRTSELAAVDKPPEAETSDEPRSLEDVAATLEHRFADDRAATAAMVSVQNTFVSLFSNPDVKGANLVDIKCRATICRAEVDFDHVDSDMDFARYAFLDPNTRVDRGLAVSVPIRRHHEGGRVSATMFMFTDP